MMDERTSIPLDAETKVAERPDDHKTELRLWLRLLTCTTLIENEVRRRLRDQFDITLPRFDLLAQLDRAPNGMTLGELSQRMMVSNGNITGLVDRLAEQGLIAGGRSPTRSPRADRQPHARRAEVLPQHGAGQRRLGRRDFRRPVAARHRGADAAARQDQAIGAAGAAERRRAHERGQSGRRCRCRATRRATSVLRWTARSRR